MDADYDTNQGGFIFVFPMICPQVVSVQTAGKYDDFLNGPEEEEEPKVKSRINAKRLYIYNTGE